MSKKALPKLPPCRKPYPSEAAGVVTASEEITFRSLDEMGLTQIVPAKEVTDPIEPRPGSRYWARGPREYLAYRSRCSSDAQPPGARQAARLRNRPAHEMSCY